MLKKDYVYYFILIITIIFSIFRIYVFKPISIYNSYETDFEGIINKIDIDGNQMTITIKTKEKIIGTYYIKTLEEKENIEKDFMLGDIVKIVGTLNKPNNNTVPNLFNYKNYLYNNKIFWNIKIDRIEKINKNSNIFINIKNYFIKRINKIKNSKNYLHAFILGDSNKIDNRIKETYQNNGISHLFAVSGMHVTLFIGMISIILKKLKFKQIIINIISIGFIIFYMYITNFSPSILRAGILFILLTINKLFNLNIKSINIMILLLSIILIINPFLIFNLGFQFSYTISLFLILFQNIISRQKNYFRTLFSVSMISFLVGLPISVYNFYQVNILGIFLNLIFVPLISFIVFPLSLITFIFPIFDNTLKFLIYIMEYLSLLFDKINLFKLIMPKPNLTIIILYYLIIVIILYKIKNKNYKYILIMIILVIFHCNISYLNRNITITFLNVGQGDSALISLPYNKGNILIDTGGKKEYKKDKWMITNSNNSISNNFLSPYFKSVGIKKIDYLIITHGGMWLVSRIT